MQMQQVETVVRAEVKPEKTGQERKEPLPGSSEWLRAIREHGESRLSIRHF